MGLYLIQNSSVFQVDWGVSEGLSAELAKDSTPGEQKVNQLLNTNCNK
jgi:hypothetical protein